MFKRWLARILRKLLGLAHVTTLVGTLTFVARNADGSVAWTEDVVMNGDTTAGLNDMLSVYFNSGSQKTAWYSGLINNSGFSALSASDTISSHAGWSEYTGYSESVRQTWTPNSPSAGVMTGSSMVFTFTESVTMKGAFIVSNNTKGGTTGTLFATGAFSSTQAMSNGQTLTITYTKTLTAA